MKTLFTLIISIMTSFGFEAQAQDNNGKSIVVYFSRRGNNYLNGEIVNLKVGNTEVVAGKIQKLTGGDIFRIEPVVDYPADYHECTEVAQKEKGQNARPKFKGTAPDMAQYDTIYLGYPNWWGTMPMVVFTFLESYDLSGKTIVPFCTHEGSAMGQSEGDIKRVCPKSTVKKGLAIRGSQVGASDKAVENWIRSSK